MGLVGLAMDFLVSLAWGVVFTVLYNGVSSVRRNVIVSGLAFRGLRYGGDDFRDRSNRLCSADA